MQNEKEQTESKEADSTKERPRNADKRARVFDLNAMFQETRKTAETRTRESEDKKEMEHFEKMSKDGIDEEIACTSTDSTGSLASRADQANVNSSTGINATAVEEEDDDDFLPMLPPGFVPDKSVIVGNSQTGERKASPSDDSAKEKDNDNDSDSDFEDYNGEGIPTVDLIPTACEAAMRHSAKSVSALRFEPSGMRFCTGGLDYQIKVFDFQKMDMSMRADKELFPCESHVINSVAFSSNGETLLVCSGQAQIKLLDRKGKQFADTVKGDQYLVDMGNTKGHTAAVNCCQWNPFLKHEFLSCGDDGTVRIWSLDDYKELTRCINKQRKVIKTKNTSGKRAQPQTCCYSPDAKIIAAGCDEGSILAWKYGSSYVNTTYLVRSAHKGPITCICFSPDSKRIVTRGLDDSMKMWSLTDNKKPLLELYQLENNCKSTDCGFSPNGEVVYTGTSIGRGGGAGKLLFFNAENFDLVYQMEFPGVSVTRIDWHSRLNQILCGFSDGSVKIYYDQKLSIRGVLGCVTKPIKRSRASEVVREDMVLSPLTLEMFQPRGEEGEEKEVSGWRLRKYLRMRDNQLRPEFRKPGDIPMSGKSENGRLAGSGSTLHSYLAQQIGTQQNKAFLEDTDVRASILRHAEDAAANPLYIDKAYRKTQPNKIFQEKTTAPEDEEEDNELQPVFKMPRLT